MKKPGRQSPYAPPNLSEADPPVRQEGVWELVKTLTDDAVRRSTGETAPARPRGLVARILLSLTIVAGLLAAATLVYGIVTFPDAPIRATGNGFAGKHGTPRTREDFEAFATWESAVLTFFIATVVCGMGFAVAEERRNRRRSGSMGDVR